ITAWDTSVQAVIRVHRLHPRQSASQNQSRFLSPQRKSSILPMTADFTLTLPDESASDPEFVDLNASVSCRGFSGQTEFTVARRDLDRFLADAAHLSTQASAAAH